MANGIDKGIGSFDPNKTYRAFLERQNPYRPFGDRLAENLEKAGNVPKPTYFGPGDTLGGELIRGLGNLALFGTDAIVRGSGYAAAPLAAGIDALASPTYQAYLEDEIFPQISNMKAQRDRLTGLAEAFSTPRSGPVGASGIIAGGPTYRQTATPADQNAALRSQLAAAQEAGDVYLDENTGQIIGDSALMRNQMDDPMAERIGGAKLSVPDELDAVDYDTVSQFINEGLGTASVDDGDKAADQEGDPLLITGTAEMNVGTDKPDESPAEKAFKSGYDAYLEALGESVEVGTIEDYKKEFADATGIDISGEVDNSSALMAFGLALMQNKAGKGFNVGNILSSVGEAGAAAQPLMIQAKKEARAAQLSGGKYALEQRKAAQANRQAVLESERDRINELLKQDREFAEKRMLEGLKQVNALELARIEHENAVSLAAAEGVDLYTDKTSKIPLFDEAPDIFKVEAFIEDPNAKGKVPVLLTAASEQRLASQFAASERALDKAEQELIGLTDIIANENITTQAQIGSAIASLGRGFGIAADSELSPVAQAKIILRRIATEEAPAILGEAGKTISDADRERVTDIVGEIGLLQDADPQVILNKLQNVYKTIVESGRNNLDTAYNTLNSYGYKYGPYAQQQQQSTGMAVGDERDIGGVTVRRTG